MVHSLKCNFIGIEKYAMQMKEEELVFSCIRRIEALPSPMSPIQLPSFDSMT